MQRARGPILSAVQSLGSSIQGILSAAVGGLGLMSAFNFLRESVKASNEAIQTEAKLSAVLRATGNAAGFTIKQLMEYSSQLEANTTISDDAFQDAMAVMAKFRKVTGDTFKRAIALSADLSQLLGTDVTGATQTLGRALQDPVRGLMALSRAGITFDATQRTQIKNMVTTGRLAEAQAMILDTVAKSVGGVAAAMAKTDPGRLEQMKNTINNLQEEIGQRLMPVVLAWNQAKVQLMQIITKTITVTAGLVKRIKELMSSFADIIGPIVAVGAALGAHAAIMKIASMALVKAAIAAAVAAAAMLAPLIKTAVIIGLLIAGVKKLISWLGSLKPVQDAIAAAAPKLAEAWERIKMAFANIGAAIVSVGQMIVNAIRPIIASIMQWMGIDPSVLSQSIGDTVASAITYITDLVSTAARYFQIMTENWRETWELIKAGAMAGGSFVIDVFSNLATNIAQLATATWTGFTNAVQVAMQLAGGTFDAFIKVTQTGFALFVQLSKATFNAWVQSWVGMFRAAGALWPEFIKIATAALQTMAAGVLQWMESIKVMTDIAGQLFADLFSLLPTLAKAAFYRIAAGMAEMVRQMGSLPELLKTAVTGGDVAGAIGQMMGEIQTAMDKSWDFAGGNKALADMASKGITAIAAMSAEGDKVNQAMKRTWEEFGGTAALKDFGNVAVEQARLTSERMAEQFQTPDLLGAMSEFSAAGSALIGNLTDGAGQIGAAFSSAFAGMDLKPLLEASGITGEMADKAREMFKDLFSKIPKDVALSAPAEEKAKEEQVAAKSEEEKKQIEVKLERVGFAEVAKKIQESIGKSMEDDSADRDIATTATEATKHTKILGDIASGISAAIGSAKPTVTAPASLTPPPGMTATPTTPPPAEIADSIRNSLGEQRQADLTSAMVAGMAAGTRGGLTSPASITPPTPITATPAPSPVQFTDSIRGLGQEISSQLKINADRTLQEAIRQTKVLTEISINTKANKSGNMALT